jgi:L,D-peptidoglycan transpeptidase YkuD (ErfK/YbiS/YcfS/YnhG family)
MAESWDEVVVRPEGSKLHLGVMRTPAGSIACAIGRAGMTRDKVEGDGATPVGSWLMRRLLLRPGRWPGLRTALPTAEIGVDDGWCDDPLDRRYNMPVRLPYPASCETLWRDDALYDAVVVLGYNDDPPLPGLGSAIFMHVATPDYGPTAGCVALSAADLLRVLPHCRSGTLLTVAT